jgi:hypothetical protein
MSDARTKCPRCGQDWLQNVRLVHLAQDAVLCPECDALWLPGDQIALATFRDYGTYMEEHGRREPEREGELLIRGPLLNHSPP